MRAYLGHERPPGAPQTTVLFIDLGDYSRLSFAEQSRLSGALRELVCDTTAFKGAQSGGRVTFLATGDGMAILFRGEDATAAVKCSLELARAASRRPDLGLRMGLHACPAGAPEKPDVNDGSINVARRVADQAEAGEILLSQAAAVELITGNAGPELSRLCQWSLGSRVRGASAEGSGCPSDSFSLNIRDFGGREIR